VALLLLLLPVATLSMTCGSVSALTSEPSPLANSQPPLVANATTGHTSSASWPMLDSLSDPLQTACQPEPPTTLDTQALALCSIAHDSTRARSEAYLFGWLTVVLLLSLVLLKVL